MSREIVCDEDMVHNQLLLWAFGIRVTLNVRARAEHLKGNESIKVEVNILQTGKKLGEIKCWKLHLSGRGTPEK